MVRFVVMAAGMSSRMGKNKLALSWRDTTVFGHVLNAVLDTLTEACKVHGKPAQVMVVARHALNGYITPELISKFYGLGGIYLQSPEPRPLSATIRMSLQDFPDDINGICFVPADQVGVDSVTLTGMLHEFILKIPDFLVPVAANPGAPVFFHRRYVPELARLSGEEGGKKILNSRRDLWLTYPVQESFFADVDTEDEYNRLKNLTQIIQNR